MTPEIFASTIEEARQTRRGRFGIAGLFAQCHRAGCVGLYAVFESESRLRLRGRDENDWQVLATTLALACGIWTEDVDFFGTGIAAWTTNRIEIFLKAEVQGLESQEE